MSRVTIASDGKGAIRFATATSTGRGKLGQIKVATLFGRSYSLALTNETKSLNRGSFIDFLNAKAKNQNLPELKKGWFFGYFGSSDKEIKEVFDKICSNADKELHNQMIKEALINEKLITAFLNDKNEKLIIDDKNEALTKLNQIQTIERNEKSLKTFFKEKITEDLQNNHDFRLEAMKINPSTIELTGTDLAKNLEFMTKALEIAPKETLNYAQKESISYRNKRDWHENLRKDSNFIIKAIEILGKKKTSPDYLMLSPAIYMNIHEDLLRNRDFIFKLAVLDFNFINLGPFRQAIDFIFPQNKKSDHQDHKDRKNFLLDIAIKNNEADIYVVYHFGMNDETLKTAKAKRQKELAEQKK